MREIAWPGHPLGRPVVGSTDSVRRLSREDAIYFVHQHYVPSRVIVAAAGRLDHDDFVASVRDGFWRMLGQHTDRTQPPVEAGGGTRNVTAPLTLAYFSLGLPAPAYGDTDRYAMHVLTRLLGGGVSSRLYRRVREERGWAYDISADYLSYRDTGLLTIEGSTAPETLFPVLRLVSDELAQLAGAGLEDDDLQRAHAQIRSQLLLSGEDMHTRMSRLAVQSFYFGRPLSDHEVLDGIGRVDAASVARVAERCLNGGHSHALAAAGPASLIDIAGGRLDATRPASPALVGVN